MCSCRSVRDPSTDRESFRCTIASRSRPTSWPNRPITSAAPSADEMSYPAPHRWAVSRQNPNRSGFDAVQDCREVLDARAEVVATARRILEHQADAGWRLGQDGADVLD